MTDFQIGEIYIFRSIGGVASSYLTEAPYGFVFEYDDNGTDMMVRMYTEDVRYETYWYINSQDRADILEQGSLYDEISRDVMRITMSGGSLLK